VREEISSFHPEGGACGGGHGHDETFAEDHLIANQVFSEHQSSSDGLPGPHTHWHDDSDCHEHS
jgi:hypothetical protein